jgi:uncharacterized damage-inducible protein DinB
MSRIRSRAREWLRYLRERNVEALARGTVGRRHQGGAEPMEIPRIEPFLGYFKNVRERTRRVVERIPPESIDWTYQEGKFSLGDLVRHLAAIERFMFAENVTHRPSSYPGHGRDLADGHEAVMRYFHEKNEESFALIASLTDDDLVAKCMTPGGASMPVWKWLRAMVEHEIHHRGQIYIYLGMLGVETPPLYGLTSEEVRARSVSRE